ncbi:MAG: aldehyde dehydrogenase family protein [Candidatus Caenarcaniphilales bacterium]|nr:aldehyde dehydrogenase family protein [Candidatus Caenarcaniphilales bacterium]
MTSPTTTQKLSGLDLEPELKIGQESFPARQRLEVHAPFSAELIGSVPEFTPEQIEMLIQLAGKGFEIISQFSAYRRAQILNKASQLLSERREEFAKLLTLEIGKPIKQARQEVHRAIDVLKLSSEEALRIDGQVIPLSRQEANQYRQAHLIYQPLGIVLAITPFNFPVSTSLHKLAPAIAAGNAVIYKPSPSAPLTGHNLAQIFYEAGLPVEALQTVHCTNIQTEKLAQDPRIKLINFTGSSAVGWNLRRLSAPGTRALLELGGNSPVIVHKDARLEKAIPACLRGAFAFSGQTCISVQRIYVHKDLKSEFTNIMAKAAEKLSVGDPQSDQTDLGPLIKAEAVKRVSLWVSEAIEEGAHVLTGAETLTNQCYSPTIIEGLKPKLHLVCSEVFGPVVSIFYYDDLDETIDLANDTHYGLSAGLFTQDFDLAHQVSARLNAGTVMINDSSTFRADEMPIGGQNQSGLGIEGPRYAIREMSRTKLICLNLSSDFEHHIQTNNK